MSRSGFDPRESGGILTPIRAVPSPPPPRLLAPMRGTAFSTPLLKDARSHGTVRPTDGTVHGYTNGTANTFKG